MSKRKETRASAITSDDWMESFAPTTLEELAVHTKKIEELQNWLLHCDRVRKPPQLCLLSGPSGCGKTTALRLIAEKCEYEVQEWLNPVDQELITTLGDQSPWESAGQRLQPQMDLFRSFLFRASRYQSLLARHQKRLLLVEDFPNALLSDPALFEGLMEEYLRYGLSPLLFIVADTKSRSLDIGYKLFTEQLKCKFRFNHITFNPIATTIMQKAMKRFCTLMCQEEYADEYKVPSQTILDSIVLSAQGDIRNALINLHFASLKGAPAMMTVAVPSQEASQMVHASKGKGAKRKKLTKLESVGRDESITMLHALGRVFNPKYTEDQRLLHAPDDIADSFSAEPKKLMDLLYANYLKHFSDVKDVPTAMDGFCLADLLFNEYRDADALAPVGLNILVRAIMLANSSPVSGWLPIQGGNKLRFEQNALNFNLKPEVLEVLGLRQPTITKKLYALEYGGIVKSISDRRKDATKTV